MSVGPRGAKGEKGDPGKAPATSVTLQKQGRRNVIAYVGLLLCVAVALAVSFRTQHRLSQTTKESARTRIVTVEQRCDLTNKIREVLATDDPRREAAFRASYAGCEKQLQMVKRIAAKAP